MIKKIKIKDEKKAEAIRTLFGEKALGYIQAAYVAQSKLDPLLKVVFPNGSVTIPRDSVGYEFEFDPNGWNICTTDPVPVPDSPYTVTEERFVIAYKIHENGRAVNKYGEAWYQYDKHSWEASHFPSKFVYRRETANTCLDYAYENGLFPPTPEPKPLELDPLERGLVVKVGQEPEVVPTITAAPKPDGEPIFVPATFRLLKEENEK